MGSLRLQKIGILIHRDHATTRPRSARDR
jgi:hypothetical protein